VNEAREWSSGIEKQKSDLTRQRISDEHWEIIRADLEARGYNRSAYEHELAAGGKRATPGAPSKAKVSASQARATYIIKLEGPLSTPEHVTVAAGLTTPPEFIQGEGDDGDTSFCIVNGIAKQAITEWLALQGSVLVPTFARIANAAKELSTISMYPTLGIDSTLPQHRTAHPNTNFEPAQDQYPVWYFFYSTLDDSQILSRVLRLPEDEAPPFLPASIRGGKIETWARKYKALVDASVNAIVNGSAYKVMSKEYEDALQGYETDNYEVVRCTISIEGGKMVKGCTFRFVGTIDLVWLQDLCRFVTWNEMKCYQHLRNQYVVASNIIDAATLAPAIVVRCVAFRWLEDNFDGTRRMEEGAVPEGLDDDEEAVGQHEKI
jgi:hypothetical protein